MKSLAWTLCFVVALNGLGIAQATKPPSQKMPTKSVGKPEAPELPLQQQRAIAVLESLAKETIALDDQPLRIKTQAKIADTLWSYNQTRAREIFTEAFHATNEIPPTKFQNNSDGLVSDKMLAALFSDRSKLQREVLQLIFARDAEFAEKLRAAVAEKSANNEVQAKEDKDIETAQKLDLAQALAKSQPEKAAQIVRQILASGYNPNVGMVLSAMRLDHPDLVNTLFMETLAVARKSDGPLGITVGSLIFYFVSEMDRLTGKDPMTDPARAPVMQPFLAAMLEAISRHVAIESDGTPAVPANAAAFDFIVLQQITPFFAKFMPDAMPTIRLRTTQLTKHISSTRAEEISKGVGEPNYETTIKEAESATDVKRKDRLYGNAAYQAVSQGKYEEAVRLVEKIQDREYRYTTGSIVRYQIAYKAMFKDEVEEALRYAREIEFSPQRVLIYQKVAEKFIGKKDYQRATETLSEIERWLEASAENPKKAKGLLDVAGLVASFDPTRGFAVVKLAAQAINNADFKTPPSKTEVHIKIDSLDFAHPFAPLARADFERALLVAQSMQKKEAAVLAQVEICKAALAGTQVKKP
ncbi:MAG TPA: hypothetical protein VFZ34_09105 [Blastocatellia bacterium]|nr:hypothetical protein [Blastocatellia bacterium]